MMVRTLLYVLVFALSAQMEINAQQKVIDSLMIELKKPVPKDDYSIYVALARCYGNEMAEYDSAILYLNLANEIIIRSSDTVKIVETGRMLGVVYNWSNQYSETIRACLKVLPIAIKSRQWLAVARLYNLLGIVYTYYGQYDRSLDYYLKALDLNVANSAHRSDLMLSFLNIGTVYYKLLDYSNAIEYSLRGLAIADENDMDYPILLLNLSIYNSSIRDFAASRKWLIRAFHTCKSKNCHPRFEIHMQITQGLYYYRGDSLKEAEEHLKIGLEFAQKSKDNRLAYDCYDVLAELYQKKGNLNLAKQALIEAEGLSREFRRELLNVYGQFILLYKAEGNVIKVAEYQEKYIQMKDSIYNEGLTANLMQLHADAEQQGDLSEIASQVKMLKLKRGVVDGQRFTNALIGIGVVILSAILVLLFWISHNSKSASRLLSAKVRERTRNLEHNHLDLEQNLKERADAMNLLTAEIQKSIVAMKALCAEGSDQNDNSNALRYFQKIEATTDQLTNALSSISSRS